ncbi:MAG: hypothetical protein ACI8Y7_000706 [Candidatus Woesearchaeota archaeon]|jgi:hypothetical protein
MRAIRKQKKGSLSLSMNAIVIIVIAVSFLGLAIVLMKSFLGAGQGIGESILETEKDKITETLRSSNEPLSINPKNIETDINSAGSIGVGVYNKNDQTLKFKIKLHEVIGGELIEINNTDNRLGTGNFNWYSLENQLTPRTALVKEVSFKAKDRSGLYRYLIQIVETPAADAEPTAAEIVYAQKDFTIQVG